MLDPLLALKLTQATTEAAMSNAATMMSVWSETATTMLDFWGGLAGAAVAATPAPTRRSTARSWYRQPEPTPPPMSPLFPFWSWQPTPPPAHHQAFAMPGMPFAPSTDFPFNPWQAWAKFLPVQLSTPAWPMAFAFMAGGMPAAAAWPTAEASAHVMEASRKATQGVEQMFASYRSEGGHALAQIFWPKHLH